MGNDRFLCLLVVTIVCNIVRTQFVLVHFIMDIIEIIETKKGGKKLYFNILYMLNKNVLNWGYVGIV